MRLRRSDPWGPGIGRRRRGRGWQFVGVDGEPLPPEQSERVRHLAIPPAWREVWICPHPDGHIQAVGRDDAGRRQYLYHERWRQARDEEKFERVRDLAALLPRFREQVRGDLGESGLGRDRVVAGALRLLDRGVFRTGGDEYAEENGSHGVATLLSEHVTPRRDELRFCFPAKSGVRRERTLRDAELAALVRSLRRHRAGTDRLLAYRAGRGDWRSVRSGEINERFKELTGPEYTVKDLRTWHATVVAALAFAELPTPTSQRARKRAEIAVLDEVAEELGNTRAVARKSYVDPAVVRTFHRGRTVAPGNGPFDPADDQGRQATERAVLDLLS